MKKLIFAFVLTTALAGTALPAFAGHPCKSDIFCSPEVERQTKRMQLDHNHN